MCQAIFKRIWIHEDGTVTTEFTDIYKNIVGPIEHDLINQNTKSASAEADADSIHKLLKSYSNFFGQGLNNELLVVRKLLHQGISHHSCLFPFPRLSGRQQPHKLSSFMLRPRTQSLIRVVSRNHDAGDREYGYNRADERHSGRYCNSIVVSV